MGARETQPTHLCDRRCQKLHHETETQGGVQTWPYESSPQYRLVANNHSVSTIMNQIRVSVVFKLYAYFAYFAIRKYQIKLYLQLNYI